MRALAKLDENELGLPGSPLIQVSKTLNYELVNRCVI